MIYFIAGGVGFADHLAIAAVRVLEKVDIVKFRKAEQCNLRCIGGGIHG